MIIIIIKINEIIFILKFVNKYIKNNNNYIFYWNFYDQLSWKIYL